MSVRGNALQGNKRAKGKVTTTNATTTALVVPGGALALPNSTTWLVTADVVARRTDSGTESAGYRLQAVVRRGANAAATAFAGTVSQAVIAEDSSAWDATLAVDTTAGSVKLNVTGEAAKTVNWVAQLRVVAV